MDPKYINPLYAYQTGRDRFSKQQADASALALQDVERRMKEIQASREDEKISAELMAKKMQAEAYARQVQLQAEGMNRIKPYDDARAAQVHRENMFGPLNAIYGMAQNDIAGAAQAYEGIRDKLPPEIRAVLESKTPSTFERAGGPPIMSRFKIDGMKDLLESSGRPKSVTDLVKEQMRQSGQDRRTSETNETKLTIAEMKSEIDRHIAAVKAGTVGAKESAENLITRRFREGEITYDQFLEDVDRIRQAAALASAAQTTPKIQVPGLPVVTPLEERRRIQGGEPTLPEGWGRKQ